MPPGYDADLYDSAVYDGSGPTYPPIVANVQPSVGPQGTPVNINGANFTGATQVKFNTTVVNPPDFAVVSDQLITTLVPSLSEAIYAVQVVCGTLSSNTDKTFQVTVSHPPTISGLNVYQGNPGDSFTISGTYLETVNTVRLNGYDVPFSHSGSQLVCTVPDIGVGAWPVFVYNPDGYTSSSNFSVTSSGGTDPGPGTVVDDGLQHTFSYGGSSRQLPPDQSAMSQRLGSFEDRANMRGGFMSATGVISEAELSAYSNVFREGAEWLVEDVHSGTFIFGGILNKPEKAGGVAVLAAEGWGFGTEKQVERFLLSNMAIDQWASADSDPFPYIVNAQGEDEYKWAGFSNKIQGSIVGNRIVWNIHRHEKFIRSGGRAGPNNPPTPPGQVPGTWPGTPFMFWAPKTPLRWIHFDVVRRGGEQGAYDIDLVGTPTGPDGTLSVLQSWTLGPNVKRTIDFQIPLSYDCIGLRLTRTKDTSIPKDGGAEKPDKHKGGARKATIYVENLQVGNIATDPVYTLHEAFIEVFRRMGITNTNIAASSYNVLPYDAAKVTLPEIADDFATLGGWYWRIVAGPQGNPLGEAGPIGATSWSVDLPQTPIELLPQPVYDAVQYTYRYGGGYESMATVPPNPPVTARIYALEWSEPPIKTIAEQFAQMVLDHLSQQWFAGSASLFTVNSGQRGAVVMPGDRLTLPNNNNANVIVEEVNHAEDGSLTMVSFMEATWLVDQWLAQRQQRLNAGLSPDAATLDLLDSDDPAKPHVYPPSFMAAETAGGKVDYDMGVIWDPVTVDVAGEGTAILRYHAKCRPLHKDTLNPVADDNGGGWRRQTAHAGREHADDPVMDVPNRVVFSRIENPTKWRWEVCVRAEDVLGNFSEWSDRTTGLPTHYKPLTPVMTFMDIDPGDVHVRWDSGADAGDTLDADNTTPQAGDPRVAYCQVELWASSRPDYTKPDRYMMRQDKRHTAEHKLFHWDLFEWRQIKKRLLAAGLFCDNAMTARVRNVDAFGVKSPWSSIWCYIRGAAATLRAPDQVYYWAHTLGGRKMRVRLDYPDAYIDGFNDLVSGSNEPSPSDIDHIVFELQTCDTGPRGNPQRQYSPKGDMRRDHVPVAEDLNAQDKVDDFPGVWFHVRKGFYYRARAKVVDKKGRHGAFSPWTGPIGADGKGTGYIARVDTGPSQLNQPGRGPLDNPLYVRPTVESALRGVLVDWAWPRQDDGDRDVSVTGFSVELYDTNTYTNRVAYDHDVRHHQKRFESKPAWKRADGTFKPLYARVWSQDDEGNRSDNTDSTDGAAAEDNTTGSSKPGPGSIDDIAQFAGAIRPVHIVQNLPWAPGVLGSDARYPEGTYVFCINQQPNAVVPGSTRVIPANSLWVNKGGYWWGDFPAELISSQIVTGQIAAGAVRADQIYSGQIFGRHIAADFLMASTLTLAYDAQGNPGVFRSSPSGVRIVISAAGPDRIRFVNGGNFSGTEQSTTLRPLQIQNKAPSRTDTEIRDVIEIETGDFKFGNSLLLGQGQVKGAIELGAGTLVPAASAGEGPRIFWDDTAAQLTSLKVRFPNGALRTITIA